MSILSWLRRAASSRVRPSRALVLVPVLWGFGRVASAAGVPDGTRSRPSIREQAIGTALYRVEVLEATPAVAGVPQRWTIRVQSVNGRRVPHADIAVDVRMQGEVGANTRQAFATYAGRGRYHIRFVFGLPGHWIVGLSISGDGGTDKVEFQIDVSGGPAGDAAVAGAL